MRARVLVLIFSGISVLSFPFTRKRTPAVPSSQPQGADLSKLFRNVPSLALLEMSPFVLDRNVPRIRSPKGDRIEANRDEQRGVENSKGAGPRAERKWVPPADHPWREAVRRTMHKRESKKVAVATQPSLALPSASP